MTMPTPSEADSWRRFGRAGSAIFIAWSHETRDVATLIHRKLSEAGLLVWMSSHIRAGDRFRDDIRKNIRRADLVIAVMPEKPSNWIIAEAGLAYFQEKLLPVVVDRDSTVEPFSELQTHTLLGADVAAGQGKSFDDLVGLVEARLGYASRNAVLVAAYRLVNSVTFLLIPLVGGILVLSTLTLLLYEAKDEQVLRLVRLAHIIFGSIFAGGAAFIAVAFARASSARNLSDRVSGLSLAKHSFLVWLLLAAVQIMVGLALVQPSSSSMRDPWVWLALLIFVSSVFLMYVSAGLHERSCLTGEDERRSGISDQTAFFGNILSSMALLLVILLIVLMSLQGRVEAVLGMAPPAG